MSRDMLLFGGTESQGAADLMDWTRRTELHAFVPDPHRLQLERWIWDRRYRLTGRVMDVGVESRRAWIGAGYFTLGFKGADVVGDLLQIPLENESVDSVILTEVLEHCVDPPAAVLEVWRILKQGGFVLASTPFIWPDHRTDDYPDYWRFTEQGLAHLFREFGRVEITPCEWTKEGGQLYDLLRRFECMGMRHLTTATTGYLVEAWK